VNAPAGNGEIILTGRLGYSAWAIEEAGIKALNTAIVFSFLLLISPFSDLKKHSMLIALLTQKP
jgi:hypothetical protein